MNDAGRRSCRATAGALMMALGVVWSAKPQLAKPKSVRGRTVTTWEIRQESGQTHQDFRFIYARNDSTAPIAVTSIRLAKCVNLQRPCESFAPELRVLAPGQTVRLASVAPANLGKSYSFTFDVDWRTATECIDPRPTSGETVNAKAVPPEPTQMIVPGIDSPLNLRGQRVEVQFFVADNGRVDSVGVVGIKDRDYLARFRQVMMKYRFNPALARGCPVTRMYVSHDIVLAVLFPRKRRPPCRVLTRFAHWIAAAVLLVSGAPVHHAAPTDPSLIAGLVWRNVGPFRGGRVAAVTGAIGQPGVFYIGLPLGGVWKTTSAGTTWYPVFDGVKEASSVGSVQVAPSDPEHHLCRHGRPDHRRRNQRRATACTSRSMPARRGSISASTTPSRSRRFSSIRKIPNIVLVAAQGNIHKHERQRGVFRSTDGGKTWTKTLYVDSITGMQKIAWAFDHPKVMLATTVRHYNARIRRSRRRLPPAPRRR